MADMQILKDVDDIDHLTLEKAEDDAHEKIEHFNLRRIAPEKFSLSKSAKLLKNMGAWYPQTQPLVEQTDFDDPDSVYASLRNVREMLINL